MTFHRDRWWSTGHRGFWVSFYWGPRFIGMQLTYNDRNWDLYFDTHRED